MPAYHAVGNVTGSCGHAHRSIQSAERCRRAHVIGCHLQGGYSDREIEHTNGQPIEDWEEREIADASIS